MKLLNTISHKKEKDPGSPQRSNSSTSDSLPRSVEFAYHDDDNVAENGGFCGPATSSAAEIAARSATAQADASVKRDRAQRHQSLDITAIFGGGHKGEAAATADDATHAATNTRVSFCSDDDDDKSGHGVPGRHFSMPVAEDNENNDDDKEFQRVANRSADEIYKGRCLQIGAEVGAAAAAVGSSDDGRDYASSGTKPVNHKPFHASTGNVIISSNFVDEGIRSSEGVRSAGRGSSLGSSAELAGRDVGGKGGSLPISMRRRPSLGLNMGAASLPLPFKFASTGEVPANQGDKRELMGNSNLRRSSNPLSTPDDDSEQSGLNIKATFQKEHRAVRKFKIIVSSRSGRRGGRRHGPRLQDHIGHRG